MNNLNQIKQRLKTELPVEGISHTIKTLKDLLPETSGAYNLLINLDGEYQAHKFKLIEGVLSNEEVMRGNNGIRSRLLSLIDALKPEDFQNDQPTSNLSEEKTYKKGHVLYQIPSKMQRGEESRCLVRVAFEKMLLLEDLDVDENTQIRSEVRVSDHMKVEIIDPAGEAAFEIRSTSQAVQFVDKDDFSEWRFYVNPLLEGEHVLELKVSVIVIINGKEVTREKTLEESVTIVTEEVKQQEAPFVKVEEEMIMAYGIAPIANSSVPKNAAHEPRTATSKSSKGSVRNTAIGGLATILLVVLFGFVVNNNLRSPMANVDNKEEEKPHINIPNDVKNTQAQIAMVDQQERERKLDRLREEAKRKQEEERQQVAEAVAAAAVAANEETERNNNNSPVSSVPTTIKNTSPGDNVPIAVVAANDAPLLIVNHRPVLNEDYVYFTNNNYFIICNRIVVVMDSGFTYDISLKDGQSYHWSGNGFLRGDNKLVTARHIIQRWRYNLGNDSEAITLAKLELEEGVQVKAYFRATNVNGDHIEFTSVDVVLDDSDDTIISMENIGEVKRAKSPTSDWAYVRVKNRKSKVEIYDTAVNSLTEERDLILVGYAPEEMNRVPEEWKLPQLTIIQIDAKAAAQATSRGKYEEMIKGYVKPGGPVFVFNEQRKKFMLVGIMGNNFLKESGEVVPIGKVR